MSLESRAALQFLLTGILRSKNLPLRGCFERFLAVEIWLNSHGEMRMDRLALACGGNGNSPL